MKIIHARYTDNLLSLGLLVIRALTGLTMAVNHGYKKLTDYNLMLEKGFADPFHIGMKASLSLTIFAEFFCALLVVIGFATRLACVPLIIAMGVALFMAHQGQVFGAGEPAAIYLAIFTGLLFTGPGRFSLDKIIGR